VLAALALAPTPAPAFELPDPFGWFGPRAPQPRSDALAYSVTIAGVDGDLAAATRDASTLERLKDDPPRDGLELAQRIEADLPGIVDALWARGRYAASVAIRIDEAAAAIGRTNNAALAAAAERRRGAALVPVRIEIEPGPVYRLQPPGVVEAGSGKPVDPALLPPRGLGIEGGEPAATATVLSAAARLSDRFRERGHPFVKVGRRPPAIDHRDRTVDLTLTVEPGPVATLGRIAVTGTQDVDPAVVRSFIYAEPGQPYSPQAIAAIRKSVARIEALSAVRVREGEALDAEGRLPLDVEVSERPPRLLGGSVRYSTVDGPALRGYFAHRNLFGGAERLRFDAEISRTVLDRDGKETDRQGRGRRFALDDFGGRFALSFLKPALGGSRFDLLADAVVQRERTEAYDADTATGTLAIRRRFTDSFSIQAGIEGELGRSQRAPPPRPFPREPIFRYGLVGLPVSLAYDSTDRPLDPTTGVRVAASATPYLGFGDAAPAFGIGRIQASGYYALDEDARIVLAARLGFGSILGGSFAEIPPNRLFFAGGGGSVRGFEFKSLSPKDIFGRPLGGRSLVEGSLEARLRITETIGLVPFVDVGQAFSGALPDRSERLRIGAGLGLRYYTGIGPIRLDVAVPVDRKRGEAPYALYVSIGQAF
jgi:translocation and assembly module TamA